MGNESSEERRRSQRIDCRDCRLSYHRETGLWGKLFGQNEFSRAMPVRNICRDGVCFLCREQMGKGENLRLTISLGDNNPTIHVKGVVVRVEEGKNKYPWKVGVGFTDVSEDDWEVLCRLHEICPRRKKHPAEWRLHHTYIHENRPKGALHTPDED